MALTRGFKEPVQKRIASDPAFREALGVKASTPCLPVMSTPARRSCGDYIKTTVGFEKLGEATGTQPKSLIRMFGPRGNPQARNLFGIIGYLQKQAWRRAPRQPGPKVT